MKDEFIEKRFLDYDEILYIDDDDTYMKKGGRLDDLMRKLGKNKKLRTMKIEYEGPGLTREQFEELKKEF
jgi:hypothetical protein